MTATEDWLCDSKNADGCCSLKSAVVSVEPGAQETVSLNIPSVALYNLTRISALAPTNDPA